MKNWMFGELGTYWLVWQSKKLTKRKHIILGVDVKDQFYKTIKFYGTQNLENWCFQNGVLVAEDSMAIFKENKNVEPVWEAFLNQKNIDLFDTKALDLLTKMMRTDPVMSIERTDLN